MPPIMIDRSPNAGDLQLIPRYGLKKGESNGMGRIDHLAPDGRGRLRPPAGVGEPRRDAPEGAWEPHPPTADHEPLPARGDGARAVDRLRLLRHRRAGLD